MSIKNRTRLIIQIYSLLGTTAINIPEIERKRLVTFTFFFIWVMCTNQGQMLNLSWSTVVKIFFLTYSAFSCKLLIQYYMVIWNENIACSTSMLILNPIYKLSCTYQSIGHWCLPFSEVVDSSHTPFCSCLIFIRSRNWAISSALSVAFSGSDPASPRTLAMVEVDSQILSGSQCIFHFSQQV